VCCRSSAPEARAKMAHTWGRGQPEARWALEPALRLSKGMGPVLCATCQATCTAVLSVRQLPSCARHAVAEPEMTKRAVTLPLQTRQPCRPAQDQDCWSIHAGSCARMRCTHRAALGGGGLDGRRRGGSLLGSHAGLRAHAPAHSDHTCRLAVRDTCAHPL